MPAGRLALADRLLTLSQARACAVVAIALFALVYAFGVVRRHGLVDAFGHVIGGDLLAFRTAAAIVRDGAAERLYDFSLQAAYEKASVAPEPLAGMNPFTSPPFVALAYLPIVRLPHAIAFVCWTVAALACIPVAFRLLRPLTPRTAPRWRDAALLTLSFAPVLEGLAAGSNSIVSLPIFAGALSALAAGRDGTAGALLGLQLFRPQLLVAPLVLLAWKRRWRALAGFAAVGAVLSASAVVFVEPRSLEKWFALIPLLSRIMFEPGMPTALLSSVYAIFLLPLGPAHFQLGAIAGTAAAVALLCVVLRLFSGAWRPDAEGFRLRLAALVIVTPLVSQYLQLHDLSILALAGVLLVEEALDRPSVLSTGRARLALAALWLSCLVAPAVVSRVAPVPLAPIGALVLGWTALDAARRARPAPPDAVSAGERWGRSHGTR
jgi:hypothetical protein